MPKSYTIDDDYNDSRLDKWFKNKIINLPHCLLEKILRQNKVKVNKKKTKSSYRLQAGDLVEIYDIRGSKGKTLKNTYMHAGTHEFEWDATNRSSGIYFFKLITSSGHSTKKAILIK